MLAIITQIIWLMLSDLFAFHQEAGNATQIDQLIFARRLVIDGSKHWPEPALGGIDASIPPACAALRPEASTDDLPGQMGDTRLVSDLFGVCNWHADRRVAVHAKTFDFDDFLQEMNDKVGELNWAHSLLSTFVIAWPGTFLAPLLFAANRPHSVNSCERTTTLAVSRMLCYENL